MSTNNFEEIDGDWADEFDDLVDETADEEDEDYVSPLSSGVVAEEDDTETDDLGDIFDEVQDDDDDYISPLSSGVVADEDNLDDDFDEVHVAEPVSGGEVILRGELVGDEIVFHDTERQLTADEAKSLTDNIRSTSEVLYTLVAKAYAGKAWIPLGYASFKEYMNYEFDISVSKAYNLVNQATVIEALEAATPAGTKISINQTSAKKLKKVMDDLIPEIEEATRDMGKREATEYLDQRIQEVTTSERHGPPPGGYEDDFEEGGRGGGGGNGSGGGGGSYGGSGGFDNPNDFDSFPNINLAGEREAANGEDIDVDDFDIDLSDIDLDFGDIEELDGEGGESKEKVAAEFKNKVESTYKFYSAMVSLEEMPNVDEIIESIPETRKDEIDNSLKSVMAWLTEFKEKWQVKMDSFDQGDSESLENVTETSDEENDFDDFDDFSEAEDLEDFEEFTDNDSEEHDTE